MTKTPVQTRMAREIGEIPEVLARQVEQGLQTYLAAGRRAAAARPRGFVTCARGTSDNAATFFKYIMEIRTGLPVASIGPSVASVYNAALRLDGFFCLTVSQSGGSPDLVALQAAAKKGGAQTIALLNETDSDVGRDADTVLPILAGPEIAVAATKSYAASLFAILGFVAGFCRDGELEAALRAFPATARLALDSDWAQAALPLARAGSVYTVGRGPGLAVAAEAALKLKETCRIHAEMYSAAEVMHGPIILAEHTFVALVFDSDDAARPSIANTVNALREKGAAAFLIAPEADGHDGLPVPAAKHPLLQPLLQIVAFYAFVEALARDLDENVDAPAGLNKVTATI